MVPIPQWSAENILGSKHISANPHLISNLNIGPTFWQSTLNQQLGAVFKL